MVTERQKAAQKQLQARDSARTAAISKPLSRSAGSPREVTTRSTVGSTSRARTGSGRIDQASAVRTTNRAAKASQARVSKNEQKVYRRK